MKHIFRNIFILVNIPVAVCLLFSYTAIWFNPTNFWIPAFFGLAYPYFLLVNILFVLLWLVFNTRYIFISLIAIAAGFGFLGRYVQLKGETTDREDAIRICSYNVKYFVGNEKRPNKLTAEKIIGFLEEGKFNIICLQEASLHGPGVLSFNEMKSRLSSIQHMQLAHTSGSGGAVTFSSYPIIDMGEIRYENTGNLVIYTDLQIDADTVRVYNCHLQSYRLMPHELNSLDSLRLGNKNADYSEVRSIGSKLKYGFVKRAEQALKLEEHIRQSPYPVIVCGDFNDTPVSFTYTRARGKLKDAFCESGQGIGNTYNGRLPSFRIDYILHDPLFDSFEFKVGREKFSDHFPVYCKLVRKENF